MLKCSTCFCFGQGEGRCTKTFNRKSCMVWTGRAMKTWNLEFLKWVSDGFKAMVSGFWNVPVNSGWWINDFKLVIVSFVRPLNGLLRTCLAINHLDYSNAPCWFSTLRFGEIAIGLSSTRGQATGLFFFFFVGELPKKISAVISR